MSEHHPELSRLPTDERYWEQLEARIVGSLPSSAAEHEPVAREWWAPLAERAYPVAALALAASIAAFLLLPDPSESSLAAEGLLHPTDNTALVSPLTAEGPPSISLLVFPGSQE
jgi:hypothetical protein